MTRVLIVDDNADNLYLLRALLQGYGYSVVEARNGAEALTKARQNAPDLIISDLLMPEMDGYALLRQWKADERLKVAPFIVYTATYTDPKDERLALDLGADAFFLKPTEPEPFMNRLREVLARNERVNQPVREPQVEDNVLLKDYSEALVRKLDKKIQLLEQANHDLLQEIAERKRTEAALRESEERYRNLFHSITDPLFVYDPTTLAYLAVNDAAVTKYGYSRDEFLGMTIRDILPEEETADHLGTMGRPATTREEHGQRRHRKKSGEIIDVDVSTYGVDFSGRPACVVQARDVTEQRRAEAEVARTTVLLQALVNGTPDVVFVKDRAGNYLLVNEAAARYVGKSVAEMLGKDATAILEPEDARLVTASDHLVMESNQSQTVEEVLLSAGVPHTFQTIKVPYRDANGHVIGVIGISRDVTHQKEAERALRLRDRAIQAVSQGILITDPNLPDNPIIYASSGFERMTGYRADEVVGRNCRFLQGKDTDRETIGELHSAIAAGRGCSVEILNYRKDGRPFWNQLSISPILGAAGELTHFVGVQTDVTERRRLEDQFRQAQKMEAVGQLAGGVAHDFNNLITVIHGCSDILSARLASDDPMRELLSEINKAGERAAALTHQLLAFSRQQVLQPKVLNLNAVVSNTEKMLRRLLGEDVSLVTNLSPNLGQVKADAGQLEQVLMNLAVNARDAMPRGGRLTIETQQVFLDESYCRGVADLPPGEYVLLAVSDTGCGMDEATRGRIFEPFFTTKGLGKGTGLGLATVHGIVKQSRGHIAVYSEVGHGTAFKVYLPRVSGPASNARSELLSQTMPRGTETVLLVEDEETVRATAGHILRGCGYRVLEASNGKEGLRLSEIEPGPIHLLISDVVMPHMGGRGLAELITAKRPRCRVLFLSGYTDDAVIRHGVLEGEFAFLQKPFTPSGLAQKVRNVLDVANQGEP